MNTLCLRYLNATQIRSIKLTVQKSTSAMLGSIQTKNFDQHSLQAWADSHIIQILMLKYVATKIQTVEIVFLSNRMFHLHKRQKRIMDAAESTIRALEPFDEKNCGLYPGYI